MADDELNTDDEDGYRVTQADLDAARARWADPKHEPAVTELFARAVTGNGVRGDVLIGEESPEEETDTGDAAGS